MQGTIKKKMDDKGFGFISSSELAKDVFFHSKSLVGISFDEIKEGDNVTFDTEESPKGLNAINVTLAA
jgi:CspA family cold shock protein